VSFPSARTGLNGDYIICSRTWVGRHSLHASYLQLELLQLLQLFYPTVSPTKANAIHISERCGDFATFRLFTLKCCVTLARWQRQLYLLERSTRGDDYEPRLHGMERERYETNEKGSGNPIPTVEIKSYLGPSIPRLSNTRCMIRTAYYDSHSARAI
jgi:hypothetical protein